MCLETSEYRIYFRFSLLRGTYFFCTKWNKETASTILSTRATKEVHYQRHTLFTSMHLYVCTRIHDYCVSFGLHFHICRHRPCNKNQFIDNVIKISKRMWAFLVQVIHICHTRKLKRCYDIGFDINFLQAGSRNSFFHNYSHHEV